MVFSSTIFLLLFLPIIIIIYYNPVLKKKQFRNFILFLSSIGFYAWGEPGFVFLMLFSILLNWLCGLFIEKFRDTWLQKLALMVGLAFDIGLLFVFKYLGFVTNDKIQIALPIGISFFTFQIISYLMDIYWDKVAVQKNIMNLGLYISMFPQLIAGPIVRYETIAAEIEGRKENWTEVREGIERFIVGLGKKVLISNYMAPIADGYFNTMGVQSISVLGAWLGAIAYTLQIYFDFSGYSDMAIGLGKIFGFHFLENFNYPYISKSITEFWRRWHISLSSWFKDYVYIPLGGSKGSATRTIINLFIVWLLTGIWHGANWTFIIWGLFYFVLLTFERITGINKGAGKWMHISTLCLIIIGWVIFRSDNVSVAALYIGNMFGVGAAGFIDGTFTKMISGTWFLLLLAIIGCFPWTAWVLNRCGANAKWMKIARQIGLVIIFLFSLLVIVKSSYSPFIYFNF